MFVLAVQTSTVLVFNGGDLLLQSRLKSIAPERVALSPLATVPAFDEIEFRAGDQGAVFRVLRGEEIVVVLTAVGRINQANSKEELARKR